MTERARAWCFTLNEAAMQGLIDPDDFDGLRYLVYQEEVGGKNYHFQGYMEFDKLVSRSYLSSALPGAHFERRRGTSLEAAEYCKKEEGRVGGPYEWGTRSEQGKRNDILSVKRAVDEGASQAQLWEDHFSTMVRLHKSIRVYKEEAKAVQRSWETIVLVFVGAPGTGKTRSAMLIAEAYGSTYMVPAPKGSGLYFDGYDGQEVAIFDEFDGSFCQPTFWNRLTDRYPMSVPVHLSRNVSWAPKLIIVTSNKVPRSWWKAEIAVGALMRRITGIVWFRAPQKAPEEKELVLEEGRFVARSKNLRGAVN